MRASQPVLSKESVEDIFVPILGVIIRIPVPYTKYTFHSELEPRERVEVWQSAGSVEFKRQLAEFQRTEKKTFLAEHPKSHTTYRICRVLLLTGAAVLFPWTILFHSGFGYSAPTGLDCVGGLSWLTSLLGLIGFIPIFPYVKSFQSFRGYQSAQRIYYKTRRWLYSRDKQRVAAPLVSEGDRANFGIGE